MKLRNGSYKDYTPDHYMLGYLMTAYGYEKYRGGFLEKRLPTMRSRSGDCSIHSTGLLKGIQVKHINNSGTML